jgi:hypothetical protein
MSEDEGTRRPQPTNKWVIKSDSQVRRLETTRIDLNTPNLAMPEIVKDKQDDQDWAYGEVIYVYMDRLEAGDSPSWEWWK